MERLDVDSPLDRARTQTEDPRAKTRSNLLPVACANGSLTPSRLASRATERVNCRSNGRSDQNPFLREQERTRCANRGWLARRTAESNPFRETERTRCGGRARPPPPPPSRRPERTKCFARGAPQAPSRPAEKTRCGGKAIATSGGSIVDCGFALSSEATQRPDVAPVFIDAVETSGYPGAVERKSFALDGGSGTHLQAPSHYVVGGRSVDRFSSEELIDVPLVVIDCGAPYVDADFVLTPEDVDQDERRHGTIARGSLVAIRTGWAARHYTNRDAYYNVTDWTDIDESTGLARLHFPGVAEGAARLLRDRGVVGVVIDTMALDGPGTSGALRELLQRDAYVVANANLTEALPARGARMTVAPLWVAGAPEAPCRLYARIP